MIRFKNEIFKKLSLAFIAIIFVPTTVMIIYIFNSLVKLQESNLKKDNYYATSNAVEKLSDSYVKLERLKILIRNDIEFLDFLTDPKEKTPIQYIDFQKEFLDKYSKFVSISSEISYFKIYTDNKNLLEIRPMLETALPLGKELKDSTKFIRENNKNYLYLFREVYFYPKSIYLEMKLDLEKILGKTDKNFYFYINKDIFSINSNSKLENLIKTYKFPISPQIELLETKNYITYSDYLPFLDGFFVNVVKRDELGLNKFIYGIYVVVLVIVSLVVIYFISYFVSIRLFKQLEYVLDAVKEIKNGNLEVQIPIKDKTEDFYILSMQINLMTKRIKKLIEANVKEETQSKDFQIKALQSQINSHFIQNTLENIKMLAYINKDYKVSDAITNLGKILRYGMDWNKPEVSFVEEMEYLKRYIELFSMRLDNDIKFRFYADSGIMNKRFPKMIFQPFVENSILYGIIPKDCEGFIQIRAYHKDKETIFEILDNGIGAKDINNPMGTGIGMLNTKKRLQLYFKSEVNLDMKMADNKFTRVIIKIKEM